MTEGKSYCIQNCPLDQWPQRFENEIKPNISEGEILNKLCLHLYPSSTTLTIEEEVDIIYNILKSFRTAKISNYIPFAHWQALLATWPDHYDIATLEEFCFNHTLTDVLEEHEVEFFTTLQAIGKHTPFLKKWCMHVIINGQERSSNSEMYKQFNNMIQSQDTRRTKY